MAFALGSVNRGSDSDSGDFSERLMDSDIGAIKRFHRGGDCDLAMTSEVQHHDEGQANEPYHLKILVPKVAAGSIIGKKGDTIAQLQKETRAKIKMSKVNDFYPGTTERVCLITGSIEGILKVHDFVMEKIKDKPDPYAKMAIDFDHKQPAEREKQVKILVPNHTAGMIIGKGGSYINQIKQESGAYVQISQKYKDHVLTERCITVIGEIENNKIACRMILAKIAEDPQSGSCLNISYADVTHPVANFNPTGSPFASSDGFSNDSKNNSSTSYSSDDSFNSVGSPVTNNSHRPQTNTIHSGIVPFTGVGLGGFTIPPPNASQIFETLQEMLRGNGYSEQAVSEISVAMSTLANYGMLGLNHGILNGVNSAPVVSGVRIGMPTPVTTNCPLFPGDMANQTLYTSATCVPGMEAAYNSTDSSDTGPMETGCNMFAPTNSSRSDMPRFGIEPSFISSTTSRINDPLLIQAEAAVFDPFRGPSPAFASPSAVSLHANNNSFGLGIRSSSGNPTLRKDPIPSDQQTGDTTKIEFEVAENIVGAILGPEGKALIDIQRFSGANVQISNRGVFAFGTRNRLVTITGMPNAVKIAQRLIEQQIAEEESKRAQQNVMRNIC